MILGECCLPAYFLFHVLVIRLYFLDCCSVIMDLSCRRYHISPCSIPSDGNVLSTGGDQRGRLAMGGALRLGVPRGTSVWAVTRQPLLAVLTQPRESARRSVKSRHYRRLWKNLEQVHFQVRWLGENTSAYVRVYLGCSCFILGRSWWGRFFWYRGFSSDLVFCWVVHFVALGHFECFVLSLLWAFVVFVLSVPCSFPWMLFVFYASYA